MYSKFKKSALLAVSVLALSPIAVQAGDGYVPPLPSAIPSNPNAGECYARVKVPARFETRQEQVMVQEGYTEYAVEQPQISSRTEQVLVKEPSVQYRVRQPRYSTVTEQILVRPAYEKLQVSPPQFQTVTETRQVSSPKLVWKKGNPATLRSQGYVIHSTADGGPQGQGYRSTTQYGAARTEPTLCGTTCEIWCLVEEPGQSVSFTRRVMAQPSMINRVPVAAKYQTITKQVVADPGGVEEIPVPAEYASVTVEDVFPARATGAHEVPPQFNTVSVNVPVDEERWEWRRVVCETGTYLQPTPQPAPQPSTQYIQPAPAYVAPAPTYHQGSTYNNYESVVCDENRKDECYGQDVIDAYRRSQQYSSGQQIQSGSTQYGSGTSYDGRNAHDAYESVKRVKRRRRR